jgi:hypothetical protein
MRFFVLAGTAIIVVLIAMVYRDKIERLFRKWHIVKYKKTKIKRAQQKQIKSEE